VAVYGVGFDLLEEGQCLCFLHSIDDSFLANLPPFLSPQKEICLHTNNNNIKNKNEISQNETNDNSKIEDVTNTKSDSKEQGRSQKMLLPQLAPRTVRAQVPFGGFLLSPLSAKATYATFIYTVDPVMPYLPSALLNWGMEVGAVNVFKQLTLCAQHLHDPGSPYFVRLQEKKSFYDSVLSRFYQILQECQAERTQSTASSLSTSKTRDKTIAINVLVLSKNFQTELFHNFYRLIRNLSVSC
jgi:hypothetical protein